MKNSNKNKIIKNKTRDRKQKIKVIFYFLLEKNILTNFKLMKNYLFPLRS